MNRPFKKENRIYKEQSKASETIDKLLKHVRAKGFTKVPESFGIDNNGKHVLSYLEGFVANMEPDWLWRENILIEAAQLLRQWHDATVDFSVDNAQWLLPNDEPNEVICHSDFAPYNCVFNRNEKNKEYHLTGLIDFDVCAPGSRLWDIAYTVYRFVPLRPPSGKEISPFSFAEMKRRLTLFLETYSAGDSNFLYPIDRVFPKVKKRLTALVQWSRNFGEETGNEDVISDSRMYEEHAEWILEFTGEKE